jgi:lysophospholipase L1-like esterase
MRPAWILLFLFSLCLGLLGIQSLVPDGQKWGPFEIKVFTLAKWFQSTIQPTAPKVNTQNLLSIQEQTDKLAKLDSGQNSFLHLNENGDTNGLATLPEIAFHIDSASGIQFPGGDSTILDGFFTLLDSARKRNSPLRILHFGDSQIEGDRISGYLRQRLQQNFGGCGPGLLPWFEENPSRFSVEIKSNEPAEKFFLYGKAKLAGHNRYSVLHSLFHLQKDSNQERNERQFFSYRLRNVGFGRAHYFERATLMYRNPVSEIKIESPSLGKEKVEIRSQANDSLKLISIVVEGKKKALSLEVNGESENDFFGICLDGKNGVALDNIPLRGSSGLELLKINPKFLQEQIRRMGVKMVILQFGVNVVPYESPSFAWYENSLAKVIQTLKRADPELRVLVVGVSDIAKKSDGLWQSYPNIDAIRQAQKNAAARTQSAFWDLYEVMGGKNSILAWASTNPPLAGKDYIHLSPKGAQVVGEFLFQALEKTRTQRKSQIL